MLAFHAKHGELPKRGGKREDGGEHRLACFLDKQRVYYHDFLNKQRQRGHCHDEHVKGGRFKAMENIPGFEWGEPHRQFGDSVTLVCEFHAKYGELPKSEGMREDGDEGRLASFLSQNRQYYDNGELDSDRIGAMENIPDFKWGETGETLRDFDDSVALVVAFYKKHGVLPKRGGAREDGDEDRLANFLNKQRGYYRDEQLDGDRIKAMENIPDFEWEMLRDFEDSIALVVAFHKKHGELPKRGGAREDGDEDRLANFLKKQRVAYNKGQLDGDRIKAMENIPDFEWETQRDFGDSIALVVAFHKQHGELPKQRGTREDGDEARLAKFLNKQRVAYIKGQLDGDRIKAMENIPDFKWAERRRVISETE